jgi:SAM-dependent methyltransferase
MQNPNETAFDQHYQRRVRLPDHLNFDISTKQAMFGRLLQPLQPLAEGTRVLDVGFGAGSMLFSLPRHCRLSGLDVAASAVARATARAAAEGFPPGDFRRLDLEQRTLPWPSESQDLVICSHVLEHVADDRGLVLEILRVLRPGGSLIAMVPVNEEPGLNPLHVHHYVPATFRSLLGSMGLVIVADETSNTFANVLDRAGSCHVPGPCRPVQSKGIALLGALAVMAAPLQNLAFWGSPRDYGVLARKRT